MSASSRLIPAEALDATAFAQFGDVIQNPSAHGGVPELQRVKANQGSAEKWLDITRMRDWYYMSASRKPADVSMNMFVCKPRHLEKREAKEVFPVKILERHPFTPQTFIPMGLGRDDRGTRYLVIVAPTLPLQSSNGSEEHFGLEAAHSVPTPRRKLTLRERLLGARPSLSDVTPAVPVSSEETQPKGPGLPDLANLRAFIARGDQAVTYGPGTWHAPMVVLGEKAIEFVVVQYVNGVAMEDCQEVELEAESRGEGVAVDVNGPLEMLPAVERARL